MKTAFAASSSCSPNLNVALTLPMSAAVAKLEKRIVDSDGNEDITVERCVLMLPWFLSNLGFFDLYTISSRKTERLTMWRQCGERGSRTAFWRLRFGALLEIVRVQGRESSCGTDISRLRASSQPNIPHYQSYRSLYMQEESGSMATERYRKGSSRDGSKRCSDAITVYD